MQIENLYDTWKGEDVYILGTGPTSRLVPIRFFLGRCVIGLNQAWRLFVETGYYPPFNLTAHPELLLDYVNEGSVLPEMRWIVKRKPPMRHLTVDDPEHYVYVGSGDLENLRQPPPHALFKGRGIQCTAIHLAALMGAAAIYLVGVDMNSLGGDHHGIDQHVQFHGLSPEDAYLEYRVWTDKVRRAVFTQFGVPVLSLSPLLGEDAGAEEYARLVAFHGLPQLPKPEDRSEYVRETIDL